MKEKQQKYTNLITLRNYLYKEFTDIATQVADYEATLLKEEILINKQGILRDNKPTLCIEFCTYTGIYSPDFINTGEFIGYDFNYDIFEVTQDQVYFFKKCFDTLVNVGSTEGITHSNDTEFRILEAFDTYDCERINCLDKYEVTKKLGEPNEKKQHFYARYEEKGVIHIPNNVSNASYFFIGLKPLEKILNSGKECGEVSVDEHKFLAEIN